jgi:uncharacterized integral membrane protein (TIGR00698 family)
LTTSTNTEKVVAAPRSWWSIEDWVAVWIGATSLVCVLIGYRPSPASLKWETASQLTALFSPDRLLSWAAPAAFIWLLATIGIILMKDRVSRFVPAFPIVFLLAFGAQALAANAVANKWGIESVIFALVLGLLVSNLFGTPEWLMPAVRTEFYIKTGLILMGATILFAEIVTAGSLGILQSVLVVVVVWYFSFWLAKKMRLDDEFATMLSTAVSICGVSAAIAACGAIEGDRRKLSYITSIVLIVAIPMIVVQPWLVRWFGVPDVVAGAWLGGTLDTTGSVVAAGELISETAAKVGTIVKFSQNVLIGVAAFLLSVWWSARTARGRAERPTVGVIWSRFPKFVLGFIIASLVFSFVLEPTLAKSVRPVITSLRNIWFALAFVSIGLETRFSDLLKMEDGRPLVAFVGAQTFNIIWTLLLAWAVFGGLFFAVPSI